MATFTKSPRNPETKNESCQVGPGEQKKFSPNLAISKALPATGYDYDRPDGDDYGYDDEGPGFHTVMMRRPVVCNIGFCHWEKVGLK